MTSTNELVMGDKVSVDGRWLARVIEVRGSWIVVQEEGTRRRDEVQASRVKLAIGAAMGSELRFGPFALAR